MSPRAEVASTPRGSRMSAVLVDERADESELEFDSVVEEDSVSDHRRSPRRRGKALAAAIFEATMAEIHEVGYTELTMERVASRARASKGSLYRRWSSRAALVVDALDYSKPHHPTAPDTGSVREDMLGYLLSVADGMNGADGEAGRGLMAECVRDPELMEAVRLRFADRAVDTANEILTRGAVRGEVRASALTRRVASVGPALLRQYFLTHGAPVPREVVVEIVDEVVVPLVAARTR